LKCVPVSLAGIRQGNGLPERATKKQGVPEAFDCKTRRRVTGSLFGDPRRSNCAIEIVRDACAGSVGTVERELAG
jgi:hypothetical protein